MKICLPSRFGAKFQIANFLYRWFFLAILNCWTCSFEIKNRNKIGKIRENTKRKNESRIWTDEKNFEEKIEKQNKIWEEKKWRFFFWIQNKKVFPHQNKTNNKKSHSLCATIMTLYNIVTITTYITIRMSHIPIHHQNLVWKKCSI